MTAVLPAALATRSHHDLVDGRYRLLARLGRGATAQVWSAEDERLRRIVALKLFAPGATDQHRQQAELELMVRLAHPGLVSLYDAGSYLDASARGCTYLVLEFVPGGTLRDRRAVGLPADRVAAVGAAVANALSYVHACGVVHRDVKPANILLDESGECLSVKLADFGVARLLDGPGWTEPGTTVGTANYLSPEQLRGRQAGPPSDIYSLGLVLLEALTGRMAYPGSGPLTLAELDRTPSVPDYVGPQWSMLLSGMTREDASRRPAAAEVAARLTTLSGVPAWR